MWRPVTEGLVQDDGPHVSAAITFEVQRGWDVPQAERANLLIANLTLPHRSLKGMDRAGHYSLLSLDFSPLIARAHREVKAGSGARVEPFVDLSQTGSTDVCVDLGGGNIGVSEHELQ